METNALAGLGSIVVVLFPDVKRLDMETVSDSTITIRMELDAFFVALLVGHHLGRHEQGEEGGDYGKTSDDEDCRRCNHGVCS